MISSPTLTRLVLGLRMLICSFAVFLGAAVAAHWAGDTVGSRWLGWIAAASLVLAVLNLVVLVMALGIDRIADHESVPAERGVDEDQEDDAPRGLPT